MFVTQVTFSKFLNISHITSPAAFFTLSILGLKGFETASVKKLFISRRVCQTDACVSNALSVQYVVQHSIHVILMDTAPLSVNLPISSLHTYVSK